ncbi:efflux RND transporter permease subunit [Salinisphaera sp. P385]|uniref:Efflux RND transporter permease subunit n=1 Tax=Spectribacter acetivorans TaxID=3075603 RepID=A0ABU3BAV4_9GAMM|nr:efflux RND transporter permease subunit [Salinisphaera sp. P385]MDT0618962.1 efflux RND transporter permease subunit [Salinisphaera sp. P385]
MSDRLQRLLANERLIFTLVAVLALAGLAAYLTMDRQEDPAFPYRAGLITVAFPGADPGRIERLVLEPIEEELAGVEEIDHTESTARQGVAIVRIELQAWVYDTDSAWDRVRVALDSARRDFPDGVAEPALEDRIVTASTAVLAVTGSDDPLALADAAERLKSQLLDMPGVSSIRLIGDPEEQITIALSDAALLRSGLTPNQLLTQLQSSNAIIPGGSLRLSGRSLTLRPQTDYASLSEIRDTPITLAGGNVVPLGTIAEVVRGEQEPPEARVRFDGKRAVGLDIKAERNRTNVVKFGQALRAEVDELRPAFAPLEIREMFYQPTYTESRLDNLVGSLLLAVLIIVGVLFLGMGLRVGLLVATLLPLVTLCALGIYAMGGGVLHQIAIIGMVIALGILVDNAIVMTENIQHHLNRGASRASAAAQSVRELGGPLFAATGTTLAAFVPMALSEGNTGDFIRAMPILIMLSLVVSYVFAITLTPVTARRFLRRQSADKETNAPIMRLAEQLSRISTARPWWMAAGGALVVAAAFASGGMLDQQFFPNADRNQVLIDLTLPEGTHLTRTREVAARMERDLRQREDVHVVHSFVGFAGPTFYYNLQRSPSAPQRARLVAETDGLTANQAVIDWARTYGRESLPGVDVVPSILRQGPPVASPIEIRVFNPDPDQLAAATEQVFAAVLGVSGARDVRQDLGTGAPGIVFDVHDQVARRLGISRVDIAQALQGRSLGINVGQYRAGEDPVPIQLRSPQGQLFPLPELETINVYTPDGRAVPLAQVASARLAMQPGAVRHYNQHRVARVYSELAEGFVFSEVVAPVQASIADLDLPPGTRIEFGGEAEASRDANSALLQAAPLGVGLLLFFLLLQFNSFRRMGLVLLTIPFAVAGVIPGLLLLGIPFGFQPLQGIIALVGIVVNNAIVLIDVIDQRLAQGEDITTAVRDAVRRRTRPILLTTATTIAGLLPLALSDTTLWPPMAWTIITGLIASTLLTLLVMPALCLLLLGRRSMPARAAGGSAAALLAGLVLVIAVATPSAQADEIDTVDFNTAALAGANELEVDALAARTRAARAGASAAYRDALAPKLSVRARASRSDATGSISVPGPMGQQRFETTAREQSEAIIEIRQPLLRLADQLYGAPAQAESARASLARTESLKLANALRAASIYLEALRLQARLDANTRLRDSLSARVKRVAAQVEAGRALETDRLDIDLALQEARREQIQLTTGYRVATTRLARAMGRDGRVVPAPLDYTPPAVNADPETLLAEAIDARRDLDAIEHDLDAARLQTRAASSRWLPEIDAVASQTWRSGNAFFPDDEGRIAAELTWTPFAGGVIAARRDQAEAQRQALDADRRAFMHEIRVQIEEQLAAIDSALALADLAETGLSSARSRLKLRDARFRAGRATADDVVEAEAELARQQARRAIARYDHLEAWIGLQGALARSDWVTTLPD